MLCGIWLKFRKYWKAHSAEVLESLMLEFNSAEVLDVLILEFHIEDCNLDKGTDNGHHDSASTAKKNQCLQFFEVVMCNNTILITQTSFSQ